MRFFDKKIEGNITRYILQCLIATGALLVVLYYMDIMLRTAIVASIGSTSFIIFTMPHKHRSKAYYILGGYAVGTVCGVLCNVVLNMNMGININIIGALAVGISMFIMVVTNTEHPPAAGFALGIAIEGYTFEMLIFVYVVTILLLVIKWMLRKWLIDLI